MALQVINLKRDKDKVLNAFISDVLIQTNQNLYARTTAQGGSAEENAFVTAGNNKMLNFGYFPEAGVKVKLTPNVRRLGDGSEFQRGYDFDFSIESIQMYSRFQIEKFKNELCTINLHPLQYYIKDVYIQITVDDVFDKDGNTKTIISGKKFVRNIRDVYDPNPWGDLSYGNSPWAYSTPTTVPETAPETIHHSVPVGVYDMVSNRFESLRASLVGTPSEELGIDKLDLAV